MPLYPRRGQGTGELLGLSLTLDVKADAYYCFSSSSIGFKIALHSTNESPNVRETGVLLAPGMEMKLRIDPAKILTEECLPSCFDLSFSTTDYSTKISHDGFEQAHPTGRWNFSDSYVERSVAVVNMYFKDPTFRANKQTEFIGLSDFLSAVGGLMCLFLGFSFLSIAECFYFALIRPCRTCSELRQQQLQQKEQQQQQKEPQVMIPPKMGLPGIIKYVWPANWFQAEMAYQQPQRLHFNPA